MSAPMRLCARGPSGTFTASTPGDLERAHALEHRGRVHAARRHDLHRGDELVARDLPRPARAAREGHLLDAGCGLFAGCIIQPVRVRHLIARARLALIARHQRADAIDERLDVLGRRAAAAADELRAGLNEVARVARHVLGARHVHRAPRDIAWHAGVRLRAQLPLRHRGHALDRLEDRLRPHRAIEADDIRAPLVERARDILGRRAEGRESVLADRHLRDHRRRERELARRGERLLDLAKVAEGLEEKAVRAALEERVHLLAEVIARLLAARGAERLDAHAEGTDGAGDEHVRARGLARDLRRALVELGDVILESVLRELQAVRAEAVRLEQLRAGLHVRAVHVEHELGRAHVELIVALIDEHAARVEHRAHRAVGHHDALGVDELAHVGTVRHLDAIRHYGHDASLRSAVTRPPSPPRHRARHSTSPADGARRSPPSTARA